jgi:hypothetical protein
MTRKRVEHRLSWLLGIAALLVSAAAVAGRLAWAQEPPGRFPVAPGGAVAPVADDDSDEVPKPVPRRGLVRQLDDELRQVYVQSFLTRIGAGLQTEDEAGRKVEAALARRLDHLDRVTRLSDLQKRKLQAAGRGDLKRFLDRVAEAKRKFLAARDLEEIGKAEAMEAGQLQMEWAALLDLKGPLFANASRRAFTEEQHRLYQEDIRTRREYRYRAAVRWTVVMTARSLGLTDGQRRRLEAVLLEETRVPENLATYDYAIVMYQASLIPESRIRPVFDEVQWRVMSRELASFKDQERWLRAGGLIPAQIGD